MENNMENNKVNLCKSCCQNYPECSAEDEDVIFGDSIGDDNICCCRKYEPLMERDYDRGGYKHGEVQE